ncbi:MAG TPA: M56 family metallopeptidase [Candidatus Elarobacter sp.]|nr:M56 family metallopeptidase [Candidatus Elarobacter sp.]
MDALLLAILNALWQGAALIALVALALRAGLRRNATTACVVWSVAFLVVAALPAVDLTLARPATASPPAAARIVDVAPLSNAAPASDELRSAPRVSGAGADLALEPQVVAAVPRDDLRAAFAAAAGRAGEAAVQVGGAATRVSRAWGPVLAIVWSLVAAVLLLRLVLAYGAVARVKRGATPLDDPTIAARLRAAGHRRVATVASSSAIEIPCAIGFRRPMILIPAGLVATLDADDLARVVLHESAHLQRYDDCVNALEQVVCALQFFQPALFLARRRIDFEREVACDDRVLEDSGEPLRYAECLARIVQRHVRGRQAVVVPGFVLRRPQVVARVRRIVDKSRDASPHLRFGAVALGGALLATTLGIAQVQVPVVAPAAAEAAPAPAPPAPPVAPAEAVRVAPRATVTHPRAPHPVHVLVVSHSSVRSVEGKTITVKAIDLKTVDDKAPLNAQVRAAVDAHVKAALKVHVAPNVRVKVVEGNATTRVIVVRAAHAGPLPAPRAEQLSEIKVEALAPRATALERVHAQMNRTDLLRVQTNFTKAFAVGTTVRVEGLAPHVMVYGPRSTSGSSHDDDLLSAIDDAKYPHPSVDELIALKNHGVSASLVRTMGALGPSRPTLEQLVQLADRGVSAPYYAALQKYLAAPPTIEQVIALRDQGVSATWLAAMAATGYPRLIAEDATALAQQGVSSSYVRGLMDAGLRSLTPPQLIQLRNAGVDGAFVRRLYAHGYRNFGVDELIRLRESGFQP